MKKLGWNSLDLLKIDIEGYEAELLSKNADWLSVTREIVGEAHHGYTNEDLRNDLGRYGFTVDILSTNTKGGMRIFHAVTHECAKAGNLYPPRSRSTRSHRYLCFLASA
jgi:hypothetical protein